MMWQWQMLRKPCAGAAPGAAAASSGAAAGLE